MLNSTTTKIVFGVMVLFQLWMPISMIFNKETVIENGISYKFKTAPVDPTDPFRGKYIDLNFEENSIPINYPDDWNEGQTVYISLATDDQGYATLRKVFHEPPSNALFFTATIDRIKSVDNPRLFLRYPFERFYMEESKAYPAEKIYRDSRRDSTKTTYALVNILAGESVLLDVQIDGVSLKELVKEESGK